MTHGKCLISAIVSADCQAVQGLELVTKCLKKRKLKAPRRLGGMNILYQATSQ